MAKDRRKLVHIHSNVVDKQPTPTSLEYGELSVNFNAGNEFIATRNSNDNVVRFSSDEQIMTWTEKKEVIPYEGYTRGSEGPDGSTGPNSVTESDLLENKSNLIIKLNQVVANNTNKHNVVNGAKDIYNKEVNPTSDSGITDGAGFAIDMSRYAMIGANPSFSSVTTTCRATLQGTTNILGTDGDCGSNLNINVLTADTKIATATTIIGEDDTTISGNTILKVSGTTTETKKGDVTENNLANKVENTTGNYTVNTTGITSMNSTGNTCITSQTDADFYGKDNTKVGVACDGSVTTKVTAQGNDVVIDADTNNVGITAKNDVDVSAENDININANNDICETAGVNASFYAVTRTNLGINCGNSSSSTTTNLYGDTVNEVANTMNVTATTLNEEIGTETKHTSGTTTITKDGDVTENNKNNVTINTTGNTVINTTGTTDIISTGSTIIESKGTGSDMCISAADVAGFVGANKTNIGKNCADGGQTTTLNINGDTINETGNTVNISGSSDVNVSGGTSVNVSGGTNVNVQGGTQVCISAGTKANLYAPETNVGASCEGSTATTVNVSGTTINEGGTTNNNDFTTINTTANTENHTTTSFTVTTGDLCLTSTGDADFGGDTNTRIGTNCDGTGISDNTTIYASTAVTINAPTTNITGNTNISGDTIISGTATIGDTLIIKKGLEKTLSWSYGNVQSATADSTNFKEDKSFVIPQCAGDIKRRTLSWSNGAANSGSYDPGASCDNTDSGTNIVIPSGLSHLTDWSNNCLSVANNLCVNGTVTASGGFFQTSDRNAKENIEKPNHTKTTGARNVPIWKFNYKDDETHRDIYGIIAQEAEANGLNELVYTDENGKKSVDYTSLMILKIAYLENENARLRQELSNLSERVSKLEK